MSDDWSSLERAAIEVSPYSGQDRIAGAREAASFVPESEQQIRSGLRSTLDKQLATLDSIEGRVVDLTYLVRPSEYRPLFGELRPAGLIEIDSVHRNELGPIVTEIYQAEIDYLSIHLQLQFMRHSIPEGMEWAMWLVCENAVDYAVRPIPPTLMEGGVFMRLHSTHERLTDTLQYIPGSDGKVFDPPLNLILLEIGDSWVIAESFHLVPLTLHPRRPPP